MKVDMHLM